MERTPKRVRRQIQIDESPSDGNEYEGTSISYDFLPESTRMTAAGSKRTPVSHAKRRSQFVRSPLFYCHSTLKTVKNKDSNDNQRKCAALFNDMFTKGVKDVKESQERCTEVNEGLQNESPGMKDTHSITRLNETLNDSISDALYLLSQQVEQEDDTILYKNPKFPSSKSVNVLHNKENVTCQPWKSRRSSGRESSKLKALSKLSGMKVYKQLKSIKKSNPDIVDIVIFEPELH